MQKVGVRKKLILLFPILFLAFFIIQSTSAEVYGLDPCGKTRIYEQGQGGNTEYIMENGCVLVELNKNQYNPIIDFYDKINNEWFKMHLMGLEERNLNAPFQHTMTPFASMGLSGSYSTDTLFYSNADVSIGYRLQGNQLKGFATITNFSYIYSNSDLWLEVKYKQSVSGTILWTAPVVDGIEEDYIIEEKTAGINFFYYQKLGRGYEIILDPTYIVDYSPEPATHLINGSNRLENDSFFEYTANITIGVSDNLTSTSYKTRERVEYEYINEDGFVVGYFSFAPNSQKDVETNLFDIGENFTDTDFCIYGQRILGSPTVMIVVNDQLTTIPVVFDFLPSWKCVNIPASYYTSINSTNYVGVRCKDCTASRYFQVALSYNTQTTYHSGDYGNTYSPRGHSLLMRLTTYDNELGEALAGRWSQTYNSLYNWWLRLYKTTIGTDIVTVNAYNESSIAIGQNVSREITGTGWYNINVSALMIFQNNTGMNYTHLRAWSYGYHNFSEMVLRGEQNDSAPPVIHNCWVNDSMINCSETGRFYCNITDDFDVNYVNFTINGNVTPAIKSGELWYSDISGLQNGIYNITLSLVKACDIVGQCSNSTQNVSILRNCSMQQYINIHNITVIPKNYSCEISWDTIILSDSLIQYGFYPNNMPYNVSDLTFVTSHHINITNLTQDTLHYLNISSAIYYCNFAYNSSYNCTTLCINVWNFNTSECHLNDSKQVLYYDSSNCTTKNNPYVPAINGTWISCDYCQEDLTFSDTACVEFYLNRTWYDLNYSTCCAVTNLTSDCSILFSPYNETQNVYCGDFVEGSFNCQDLPNFNVKEKEYCIAYIPTNYSNESFKCISYIRWNQEILQTNPEYKERVDSLITIWNEEESREYFTDQNGIVNFYWTKKNLQPYYDYVLGLKCSSPQRILTSEKTLNIDYESMEFVFSRTGWLMGNWHYIIAGFILFILIVGTALWIWKGAVR